MFSVALERKLALWFLVLGISKKGYLHINAEPVGKQYNLLSGAFR